MLCLLNLWAASGHLYGAKTKTRMEHIQRTKLIEIGFKGVVLKVEILLNSAN